MQTRKCHADANANANANRIRTKNNMSPSPSVGDIKSGREKRGEGDKWKEKETCCSPSLKLSGWQGGRKGVGESGSGRKRKKG